MDTIGFYAGSFDPFTNGHLHVVAKSAQLFDKVVIGIGIHPKKTRRFDKELMKEANTSRVIMLKRLKKAFAFMNLVMRLLIMEMQMRMILLNDQIYFQN